MKWISVKHSMPPTVDDYLVLDKYRNGWVSFWNKKYFSLFIKGSRLDITEQVTYWCEIPELPKETK